MCNHWAAVNRLSLLEPCCKGPLISGSSPGQHRSPWLAVAALAGPLVSVWLVSQLAGNGHRRQSAASRTPKCNPVDSTITNPCIPCSSSCGQCRSTGHYFSCSCPQSPQAPPTRRPRVTTGSRSSTGAAVQVSLVLLVPTVPIRTCTCTCTYMIISNKGRDPTPLPRRLTVPSSSRDLNQVPRV